MLKIYALGDACPLPVIKAKKALRENQELKIVVDNEIATQNLGKMAEQLGFQTEICQKNGCEYEVYIFDGKTNLDVSADVGEIDLASEAYEYYKDALEARKKKKPNVRFGLSIESSYIVVIGADTMGSGNDELGQMLLKTFIYSLTEQDVLPKYVLFYNVGARLTIESSAVLEDLKILEEAEVHVLTCGACLDYFDIKEQLAVGKVTNMYRILELMSRYHAVKP